MAATKIELHEYVAALRSMVPYVHPVGRATIECWIPEMEIAAHHSDGATFARFALLIAPRRWTRNLNGTPKTPPRRSRRHPSSRQVYAKAPVH